MSIVRSPFAGAQLRHDLNFPLELAMMPSASWGDCVRAVAVTEQSETGIFNDPQGMVVRSNCNRCGAVCERLHTDVTFEMTEVMGLIQDQHATWSDSHRTQCLPVLGEVELWAAFGSELEFLLRKGTSGLKAGETRGMVATRGNSGPWIIAPLDDVFRIRDATSQVRAITGRNAALRNELDRKGKPPAHAIGLAIVRTSEHTDPARSDTLVIQASTRDLTLETEILAGDVEDLEEGRIPVPAWRPVEQGLLAGVLAQRVRRSRMTSAPRRRRAGP